MNTPVTPAAIPWYKSQVLRGIVLAILTQVIARIQSYYHIDMTVFGLSADNVTGWTLDVISAAAAAWAIRARAAKPNPPLVSSQAKADAATVAASLETPNAPSTPVSHPSKPDPFLHP
jgi:hypothetical protein